MTEKDRARDEREKWRRRQAEDDDVVGHRFSEDLTGDDVQGHRFGEDLTGDDVAGHVQVTEDEDDDVSGHVTPPQSRPGPQP